MVSTITAKVGVIIHTMWRCYSHSTSIHSLRKKQKVLICWPTGMVYEWF